MKKILLFIIILFSFDILNSFECEEFSLKTEVLDFFISNSDFFLKLQHKKVFDKFLDILVRDLLVKMENREELPLHKDNEHFLLSPKALLEFKNFVKDDNTYGFCSKIAYFVSHIFHSLSSDKDLPVIPDQLIKEFHFIIQLNSLYFEKHRKGHKIQGMLDGINAYKKILRIIEFNADGSIQYDTTEDNQEYIGNAFTGLLIRRANSSHSLLGSKY